jgi:hypothetical protein
VRACGEALDPLEGVDSVELDQVIEELKQKEQSDGRKQTR